MQTDLRWCLCTNPYPEPSFVPFVTQVEVTLLIWRHRFPAQVRVCRILSLHTPSSFLFLAANLATSSVISTQALFAVNLFCCLRRDIGAPLVFKWGPPRSWSTARKASIPELPPALSAAFKTVLWLLKSPRVILRATFIDVVCDNIETRHQIPAESAKIAVSVYWWCPNYVLFIFIFFLAYFWLWLTPSKVLTPLMSVFVNDENLVWSQLHLPRIGNSLHCNSPNIRKKEPIISLMHSKHYKNIYDVEFIKYLHKTVMFC